MILLEKERYNILIKPLKKVHANISFAYSVIENNVSGKVYVDNKDEPKTFYIIHPYGLSLLLGDCNNKDFNNRFKEYAFNTNRDRDTHEWMQAYPTEWDIVLNQLFGNKIIKSADNIDSEETGIIELNTRVNFKFNRTIYLNRKQRDFASNIRI